MEGGVPDARRAIDTLSPAAYIFVEHFPMASAPAFGEHLKREREMRGVSLEEISAATRISVRFLEALENEQWEHLPGGIFNRGFIRSVAKFLGLDEDDLVAEYALETHERPEIAVWTKEPVRPRTNWFGIIGAIVIVLLLCGAGVYAQQRYGSQLSAWHARHPIWKTVLARLHLSSAAASSPSTVAAAPAPVAKQAAPVRDAYAPEASPAVASKVNAGNAGSAPASGAATLTPGSPLELKVEAGETSDVTVLADGKIAFSGKLEALRSLTLHAQNRFTVAVSKSNAVLLELNGRTLPPLGPPNQPGKITLTRENLKPAAGGED